LGGANDLRVPLRLHLLVSRSGATKRILNSGVDLVVIGFGDAERRHDERTPEAEVRRRKGTLAAKAVRPSMTGRIVAAVVAFEG
jgi:hypothetical protein